MSRRCTSPAAQQVVHLIVDDGRNTISDAVCWVHAIELSGGDGQQVIVTLPVYGDHQCAAIVHDREAA